MNKYQKIMEPVSLTPQMKAEILHNLRQKKESRKSQSFWPKGMVHGWKLAFSCMLTLCAGVLIVHLISPSASSVQTSGSPAEEPVSSLEEVEEATGLEDGEMVADREFAAWENRTYKISEQAASRFLESPVSEEEQWINLWTYQQTWSGEQDALWLTISHFEEEGGAASDFYPSQSKEQKMGIGPAEIHLYGEEGQFWEARWKMDGYDYCIRSQLPHSRAQWLALLSELIEGQ